MRTSVFLWRISSPEKLFLGTLLTVVYVNDKGNQGSDKNSSHCRSRGQETFGVLINMSLIGATTSTCDLI